MRIASSSPTRTKRVRNPRLALIKSLPIVIESEM
jgi:hypothetical protein